jgi:hypothetical protein
VVRLSESQIPPADAEGACVRHTHAANTKTNTRRGDIVCGAL